MRKISKFSNFAGFTMIELLVVITIIGILAVAVLSAINPIEQINKGRDTRTRGDASELINATERFFATQEQYPWNADDQVTYPSATVPFLMQLDGADDWIDQLESTAEVKTQYAQRVQTEDKLLVFKDDETGGNISHVTVCFIPTSKQFQLEAARKCCSDASCPADDPLAGTTPASVTDGVDVVDVCDTTDGSQSANNYICLP